MPPKRSYRNRRATGHFLRARRTRHQSRKSVIHRHSRRTMRRSIPAICPRPARRNQAPLNNPKVPPLFKSRLGLVVPSHPESTHRNVRGSYLHVVFPKRASPGASDRPCRPRFRMSSLRRFLFLLSIITTLLWFHSVRADLPSNASVAPLPQPALLPHYSPLCDSNIVGCLDIDDFAAHAYAHLLLLPATEQRDSALTIPYGLSLGLWGRVAGGISTDFQLWNQEEKAQHQHGQLRLDATVLLWPLLPLGQAPSAAQQEDGELHYQPAHHLRIGLHYQHQLRIGPFDGANSLGFLTDLAALRVIASRALGSVELTGSIGALYDWHGTFATGEAALQLGLYLPFFRALKVYAEVLGRWTPSYVGNGEENDPIARQSVLGVGLSFRPQARVDLGVAVQWGTGGLAPTAVIIRALALSAGRTYQGRVATPVAQVAANVADDVVRSLHEYIQSLPIDPYLNKACMLLDEDGEALFEQPLGVLTSDGQHCMVQGEKLPIGEHWERDKKKSVICHDKKLRDCLMYRRPDAKSFRVLHRPWVGSDCVLRESVQQELEGNAKGGATEREVALAVLGEQTLDKTGCRDSRGRVHSIGARYYREHGHTFICDAPRIEEQRDHCFMALPELPQQLQNQWTPLGRLIHRLDAGLTKKAQHIDALAGRATQLGEDVSEGRITLRSVRSALEAKATDIAQHASVDDAKLWFKAKYGGLKSWAAKPGIEQAEDLAEATGDALLPHPVDVTLGALTGGAGGAALRGLEHVASDVDGISKLSKKAAKAAARAAKKGEKVAEKLLPPSSVKAAHHTSSSHVPHAKPPHGNLVDDRPATRYIKVDREDNLLKHGVTRHEDPRKRYTSKQIGEGDVHPIERGPRKEMLKKERELVETNPGPQNREPWAGKRRQ